MVSTKEGRLDDGSKMMTGDTAGRGTILNTGVNDARTQLDFQTPYRIRFIVYPLSNFKIQ